MAGQDRLVINEPPLLHLNNLLVSETCIDHISNLQLKNGQHNLSKLVASWKSVNHGVNP